MTIRALTQEETAVLAHVVLDPSAWWTHAVNTFGERRAEAALAAKVARWVPSYLSALESDGAAYKSRAVRERRR